MGQFRVFFLALACALCLLSQSPDDGSAAMRGYSPQSARIQAEWEVKYRAMPDAARLRAYVERLSARPNQLGSAYDRANAEWILAQFKSWGLDARIETFEVLFPTPQERLVEMVSPTRFTAKLEEPVQSADPTSSVDRSVQLPTYNAYSIDGDVTGPLVYVNYGVPADYEQLERLGISAFAMVMRWWRCPPGFPTRMEASRRCSCAAWRRSRTSRVAGWARC